jgi:hypothetical protein
MYYSAEARWFHLDAPDEKVITGWFKQYGKDFSGKWERADIYLLLDNLTTHGIKLREGKLEIKVRTHEWPSVTIAKLHEGKVNLWSKYSFTLQKENPEVDEVLRAFAGLRSIGLNHDWIRVDKERLLVKFEVDPDLSTLRIVPETARPDQGCNVEFTRLKVNMSREYHTFNFEAFGKGVNVRKILDLSMAHVFSTLTVKGLKMENSLSFPEFISSLTS